MWTALALAAALSFPQADGGALSVSDVRFTYGLLGPTRPNNAFLPGEKVFLAYNINNLKLSPEGRASFAIGSEVLSPTGEILRKQEPLNRTATNYFGGNLTPAFAYRELPLEAPPGEYIIRVSLEDRTSKQTATHEVRVKVLPADFGIIHLEPSHDSEGKSAAGPYGVIGETLFVNFAVTGFTRDKAGKQPDIKATLRILDEAGQPTTPQPLQGRANAGIPEDVKILPLLFPLTLNRPGRFTLELTASDDLAGKTSRAAFPFTVMAAPK